jgi:DNA-directed DNA polymerase III PolC
MFLNCHSWFSLRYGTLSPEQLVRAAARWNIEVLALTDINNTSAAIEFVHHCRQSGIQPIVGIDFRREGQCLYIGLARNNEGFAALNELLSEHNQSGKPLPDVAPPMQDVWIIYPRLLKPIGQFRENELLGIRPEHVARLFGHELRRHAHKLVALSPVTFFDEQGYHLHRLLRAIDQNTLLSKLDEGTCAKKNERLIPPEALSTLYQTFPAILANTARITATCSIHFETGLQLNRQTFTGSKDGDFALLEKLAMHGCLRRYGAGHTNAMQRSRKELRIIRQQDFCAYFLIAWDIVRYAQSAGYHHVGRGSGANSIVAYNIGITDVDPLELDLYFERFINPHRISPPDFDIDFSWDERDDITDYIFKRYGRAHVALLATYNTFQGRSTIRELGKVYGLPKSEIDKIAANPGDNENHHPLAAEILQYGAALEDFPNYLSIHAGGVLISERPLKYYTAVEMMPKGFPITHFDMHHAEDWGFHKLDILSQRGLGHIKDAVELVRHNQSKALDIHDITHLKNDPTTRAQLRSGHCIGCFYIESPAMRSLLQKMRCDNYTHLVAASSIIRPGVARSGMMKAYLLRFQQPNAFEYLHAVFREQLGETFGIMVYQEDVMKIVHHFAGLDLDESDVLRRVMSGKKDKNDTLGRLQQKFFANCRTRGYDDHLSQEVWRQIESFSGYSFCKAHSASFAVESFQSLYLKAHFPLEFMVAVINNFGGFYDTEYYIHEARMCGASIHPPCVNHSQYLTTIENTDIYLGFIHLQGMERQTAHKIIQQRATDGPFRNLEDFVHRVNITREQLELLLRIGAFRFTGKSKYELMWEKNAVFNPSELSVGTLSLFGTDESVGLLVSESAVPELPPDGPFDQAFDEIELLGFPLRSPFELLEESNAAISGIMAGALPAYLGRIVSIKGYYVCRKELRTVNGQRMAFGTWLDAEGHFFDTTHFPNFLRLAPFSGKGIYHIEGKVTEEYGFHSLEVIRMKRLAMRSDRRFS